MEVNRLKVPTSQCKRWQGGTRIFGTEIGYQTVFGFMSTGNVISLVIISSDNEQWMEYSSDEPYLAPFVCCQGFL